MTDEQTPQPFVDLLRRIGWDVHTAREHEIVGEKDDSRVLAWSRAHGRVMLSFDQFRGATQAERMQREIRDRGGKLIQIGGGPEQPLERALGRLFFYHPEWSHRLAKQDGWLLLKDTTAGGFTWRSRSDLARGLRKRELSARQPSDPHFSEYLADRRAERMAAPKRRNRRKPRRQQGSLNLPDAESGN